MISSVSTPQPDEDHRPQTAVRVGNVTIKKVGRPVPIAVLGDRSNLSAAATKEVLSLMRRQPRQFLFQLSMNWLLIATAIAFAIYWQNIPATILAVLFIGTRQNVLGVLLHDQVHRAAFKSRLGEYLTNLTVAYPLGLTLEGYRRIHLAHHQCFFTDKDPDFARKQGRDWTFPQRVRRFVKNVLADLAALNLWKTIQSKSMEAGASSQGSQNGITPAWVRPVYYVVVAIVLTWTGGWIPFLIYWVLPWGTVLQVIVRWAAICEHKYNLVHPSVVDSTPMIMLRWWERLILPNLNFTTYHIYHHYYPKVPFSNLPNVHQVFKREGLVNEKGIFHGYAAFLKYLLRPTPNANGALTSDGSNSDANHDSKLVSREIFEESTPAASERS